MTSYTWISRLFTRKPRTHRHTQAQAHLVVERLEDRTVPSTLTATNGLIAFTRLNDIWVMNPDGTGETQLTSGVDADQFAAWSPDGSEIAFTRNSDIWKMNADGTAPMQLTSGPDVDYAPAWSPDGSEIAFTRDGDIYVMNANDPTMQTNLTNSVEVFESDPTWSPDSSQIAFTKGKDIWKMNADGTGKTNLTMQAELAPNAEHPAWSPDGSQIAFALSGTSLSGSDIYVMNALDGSGETLVTKDLDGSPTALSERNPAWSPDGNQIAFSNQASFRGEDVDIYVMDKDGGNLLNLTQTAADFSTSPAWQPVHAETPVQQVRIGIKPGTDTSAINLASDGVVPVTLYGAADFDVSTVDVSSVTFAGVQSAFSAYEDVDGDGYLDLVLHFRTEDLRATLLDLYGDLLNEADTTGGDGLDDGVSTHQTAELTLTGKSSDGTFEGTDLLDLFLAGKSLKEFLETLVV